MAELPSPPVSEVHPWVSCSCYGRNKCLLERILGMQCTRVKNSTFLLRLQPASRGCGLDGLLIGIQVMLTCKHDPRGKRLHLLDISPFYSISNAQASWPSSKRPPVPPFPCNMMDLPYIDRSNLGNEALLGKCLKLFVWREAYGILGKHGMFPSYVSGSCLQHCCIE